MANLRLSDLDADRQLLDLPGASLVIFTSMGCASCRFLDQWLPKQALPVQRLIWIDAGESQGLVSRYEVFHLPALFLVRDGHFLARCAQSCAATRWSRRWRCSGSSQPRSFPDG